MNKLDQLYFGKKVRNHVQDFVAIWSIIIAAILAYKLYKNNDFPSFIYWAQFLALLYLFGKYSPIVFYPLWKLWITLATILGWLTTNIILTLVWCVLFIPIGLLLKIIGKPVLNLKFKDNSKTYWNTRTAKQNDFKLMRRQF